MATHDEMVTQAVEIAKSGDKARARDILVGVLKQDRDHLKAWWAIAQVAKNRDEAIFALQQVIRLKPGDEWATGHLRRLQAEKSGMAKSTQQPPAQPASSSGGWSDSPPLRGTPSSSGWSDSPPLRSSADSSAPDESWRESLPKSSASPVDAGEQEKQEKQGGIPQWMMIAGGVVILLCLICGFGGIALNMMGNNMLEELGGLPGGGGSVNFAAIDNYDTTYSTTLAVGGSGSSTISSLFEAHNYAFQSTTGQSYTIQVIGQNGCDPRAKLVSPSGSVLVQDDDSGDGYNALMRYTTSDAGLYTVRVDVWDAPCTVNVYVSTP